MMNMKLLAGVTPPYIYHGWFWEAKFTGEENFRLGECLAVNIKIVVVTMLGNTYILRVLTSISPWTSRWNLTVWKRWESHLQSQKIIWEDQERSWLPLWVSSPKQGQRNTKSKGMPTEISMRTTFQRLLGSLTSYLTKFMRVGRPNMSLLTVTFT